MIEKKANYTAVGAFVVAVAVALIAFIIWLEQSSTLRHVNYYDVYFTGSVQGLRQGGLVQYQGVPAGRILSINFNRKNIEEVKVRIALKDHIIVKEDAVASIEYQGITGNTFLQIIGGSKNSPILKKKKGYSYPVIPSKASSIQKIVDSVPDAVQGLAALITEFRELLSKENRDKISNILSNIEIASKRLVQKNGSIDLFDQTMKQATSTLASAQSDINAIRKQSEMTMTAVYDAANSARQTATTVGEIATALKGPLVNFSKTGLHDLNQLMVETKSLSQSLNRTITTVERSPTRFILGSPPKNQLK